MRWLKYVAAGLTIAAIVGALRLFSQSGDARKATARLTWAGSTDLRVGDLASVKSHQKRTVRRLQIDQPFRGLLLQDLQ